MFVVMKRLVKYDARVFHTRIEKRSRLCREGIGGLAMLKRDELIDETKVRRYKKSIKHFFV
jgi:hypothetical protein